MASVTPTRKDRRKRQFNKPWKRIYGTDRKYTARVDRAKDRGEYTEPKS